MAANRSVVPDGLPPDLALSPGCEPSDLQHRREVGIEAQLQLEGHWIAGVGDHADALDHRRRLHLPVQSNLQRLQGKLAAVSERQVLIGQLKHGRRPGGVV